MDDSVSKSRLYVATCALVRQKYPSDLAAIIIDDPNLPAWEEAVDQAAAVIQSLELQALFVRVAEVDKVVEDKNREVNRLQDDLREAKRDVDDQVAEIVRQRIYNKETEWLTEIRELEERLYETEEILDNIKMGVEVKKDIRRTGPIRHVDYNILRDEDFDLDYYSETYRRRSTYGAAD